MNWQLIKTKSVLDSDGFFTEYSWYFLPDENKYIMIFGDTDLYDPDNQEPDFETESKEQAEEWFDNYEGFTDEDFASSDDNLIEKINPDERQINENPKDAIYLFVTEDETVEMTYDEAIKSECCDGKFKYKGDTGSVYGINNVPKFTHILGPMYDGQRDGKTVFRYETQGIYNIMSESVSDTREFCPMCGEKAYNGQTGYCTACGFEEHFDSAQSNDEIDDEWANTYGGDRTYCPICHGLLDRDDNGFTFCPECDDVQKDTNEPADSDSDVFEDVYDTLHEEYNNDKLNAWLRALEDKMVKQYPNTPILHYKYIAKEGKSWIKIVQCDFNGNEQSVFCFMDKDGNIYKAAGWNAPAKGVRATLDNPPMCLADLYKGKTVIASTSEALTEDVDVTDWRNTMEDNEHSTVYKADALAVDKDFADTIVKAMDEYIGEATKSFITYDQIKKYSTILGLDKVSYKDLAKVWDDVHAVANYYAYGTADVDKSIKLADAASAFVEVVNERARKDRKSEPSLVKEDAIEFIQSIVTDPNNITTDSEGVTYLSQQAIADIKYAVQKCGLTQEDLKKVDPLLFGQYGYKIVESLMENVPANDEGTDTTINPIFKYVKIEFMEGGPGEPAWAYIKHKKDQEFTSIDELNKVLCHADALFDKEQYGYSKLYFDWYFEVDDKLYKIHSGRVDIGDGCEEVTLPQNVIELMTDSCIEIFKNPKPWLKPVQVG